ncbi:hypothetical protein T4C_12446 [Trichinella pseudospiralis]|uniref:Uncharacterized protein n=1 Tax=Trichinella pseudospiralis TaxID=6337 RepID=A0A0V1GQS1_TRIPS|nr:hypothetical protein T4C_12446 [Trichinella pseudospiralis]
MVALRKKRENGCNMKKNMEWFFGNVKINLNS